ncbi:MAG: putative rane protein [Rhizobium sp.]|nr:putative rane protein [Rhizobium sp.]
MLDLIKRNLLKYTLIIDGIVCIAAGTAFLTVSALVAELVGPAFTAEVVIGLGAFLLLWGLFHLGMGGQAEAPAMGVKVAIVGDAIWVAGSAAILFVDWQALTTIGAAFIAVMTVAVADIMLLKMIGLGRRGRMVGA